MSPMNLLKPLRRRRNTEPREAKRSKVFLTSDHAPCTCPEPCERDHGNE